MNSTTRVKKRLFSVLMSGALVAGMFPALGMPAASAATVNTVYAAAYMGAKTTAGTTLPASVDVGGQSALVNWSIGEDTFDVPYDTVTVNGTANGGPVVANVEVIPPADSPLVYFVDSGRGGDSLGNPPGASPCTKRSKYYPAAACLTGYRIRNMSAEQRIGASMIPAIR